MNHPFMDIPIPTPLPFSWDAVRAVPIEEGGEETVPASLVPEKILVRPQYYHQMLERSVPECCEALRPARLRRPPTCCPRGAAWCC